MLNTLKLLSAFVSAYCLGKNKLNRAQIQARQEKLFSDFQKNLDKSPYYREFHLQSKGQSEGKFQGKFKGTRLEDYPYSNKHHIYQHFDRMNTAGLEMAECIKINQKAEKSRDFSAQINGYSIGASSGTSGKPSVFAVSKMEQVKWAGFILGKTINLFKKEKIALFLRSNNNLYSQLNMGWIQFKFFDLFSNIQSQIKILNTYSPGIIVAPAQVLKEIALAQRSGIISIRPHKIYNAAEVMDEPTQTLIESTFNVPVLQIYQATEGFLAISCEEGNLHLNEENVVFEKEWISDTRFTPVITDLLRTTMPIVRYRLDDVLVTTHRQCTCARQSLVIDKIEGRVGDTFYIDGVSVYSDVLMKIITSTIDHSVEFNLVQHSEHIALHINEPSYAQQIIDNIDAYLESLGLHTKWSIEPWEADFMTKRRKFKCLKSL